MPLETYPFGLASLLGGLRQYLGAPTLYVLATRDMPTPPVLPGSYGDSAESYQLRSFLVDLELDGSQHQLALTLHEAPSDSIKRESGLYRSLAPHLPILVPGFIAADEQAGWLILEGLDDLRPPDAWKVDDYREVVDNLALLHDRFWGLGEDLQNFDWLGRPLDRDFAEVATSVKRAVNILTTRNPLRKLDSDHYRALFMALDEHFSQISKLLRDQVQTLLHGDYWAGNVARPLDGRQMVMRWNHARIGPAILDVVMFHQNTVNFLKPTLPIDAALTRYRVQLQERQGKRVWKDAEWELVWDYALIWLFTVHWLERLATLPPEKYNAMHNRIVEKWIAPVTRALQRQLNITLPE